MLGKRLFVPVNACLANLSAVLNEKPLRLFCSLLSGFFVVEWLSQAGCSALCILLLLLVMYEVIEDIYCESITMSAICFNSNISEWEWHLSLHNLNWLINWSANIIHVKLIGLICC